MRYRVGVLSAVLLCAAQFGLGEQYLVLVSGKRYLGKVSGADKTKFIFCDTKVGDIPGGSKLEATLEKCGGQPVMAIPLDSIKFRLLTISEGAAKDNNQTLAKDALASVLRLQDMKGEGSEQQAKAEADKVESKAGSRLQLYLAEGQSAFSNKYAARP